MNKEKKMNKTYHHHAVLADAKTEKDSLRISAAITKRKRKATLLLNAMKRGAIRAA